MSTNSGDHESTTPLDDPEHTTTGPAPTSEEEGPTRGQRLALNCTIAALLSPFVVMGLMLLILLVLEIKKRF